MNSYLGYRVPEIFNQVEVLLEKHILEGRSSRVAMIYGEREITYSEIHKAVNRLGNSLKALGIEPENRVLIVLSDSPEFIISYLASMKIGAVPVPVNIMAKPDDYTFFAKDSRAKALIVSSDLYPKVANIKFKVNSIKNVIVVGEKVPLTLNFDELIQGADDHLEVEPTSKDDMAFWMYTSGTTGLPKAVAHLHHDIIYYMPPFCETVLNVKEEDVIFATSKMFFSYGRNASLETPFLYGAKVILWSPWPKAEDILEIVEKKRPTIFFSVPTFYNALISEIRKRGRCDLSSVRMFISAGEPLPPEILMRWEDLVGKTIVDAVGSTDVGGIYLANTDPKRKPSSSGKVISGFEVELRDENGNRVKDGEIGTLWIRNDGVTPSYWRRHEKNKEVIKGDWFNTGDLFFMDEDGYFYYQGRADDMLKVSGQWVSPVEVENVIMKHPHVKECAVTGVPSEEGLVRIKAFVVLNEGINPGADLEREIIELVRNNLPSFKTPRWISFVKELPRTATGKLMRFRLKE